MTRAQKRAAARTGKFFFRKDVYPPGQESRTPSIASSSGASSPVEGSMNGFERKERKMRNCYPLAAEPVNGYTKRPVAEEYEEMSMEEIMTGKVGLRQSNVIGSGLT
jgi:glutamate--cysteine ligase catalytic subunit